MITFRGFGLIALVAVAASASAVTFTVNAERVGWVDSNGNLQAVLNNYFVGGGALGEFRNFFVFDLSGLGLDSSWTITKTELRLESGTVSAAGTLTYEIFTTDLPTDTYAGFSTGNQFVYDSIGTGSLLGSANYTAADTGTTKTVDFDLSVVNTVTPDANGRVAIVGKLASFGNGETVFADTQARTFGPELRIHAVPEPATLLALGAGLLALRRRR